MILGEDWLEACSPMWIHWVKKQMRFTHKGKRIMLKGIQKMEKLRVRVPFLQKTVSRALPGNGPS
jgi:hypothetical protein